MLEQAAIDIQAYIEANLPAQCTARSLTPPVAYFLGLPVETMLQSYPACIIDLDSGPISGEGATEILSQLYVTIVDRDQDVEAGNQRLLAYVDAILTTLNGKRFGSVRGCYAEKHDSSNLFKVGSSRAVRMRWVQFRVRTIN
ncbi:MAG: hypothetical protein ACYC5O_00845 [Anaerolineae bacterium]